jgi:hypothetical protein
MMRPDLSRRCTEWGQTRIIRCPGLKKPNILYQAGLLILSLLLVPGALPFIAIRVREKGLTRPLVLIITISLLIIGFVITTLTWRSDPWRTTSQPYKKPRRHTILPILVQKPP